jgi:beta-glucosidase
MNTIMTSKAYEAARERALALLETMTLTEKLGQLSQFGTSIYSDNEQTFDDHFTEGKVGSYLTIKGAQRTNGIQRDLLAATRLPIPALFADDVIHGYRTTFPTPLAQSCSWNPEVARRCNEIAAKEAYRAGLKWTFSPMVDIARDPRWGRIMEGYGEDTYLCSRFSEAAVKGYQGDGDTVGKDRIYACMKHFIAYGACIGGRDYNTADMSMQTLHDVYLPPFKAGIDAGAATVMSAFEDVNGVPATGNRYLLTDVLRGELGFKGFVVSDAGAVVELIPHGFAEDIKDAVRLAFGAGCDMIMAGDPYNDQLSALIEEGKITMEQVDASVLSVLTLKYLCGLMDEPYVDEDGEDCFFCDEHMDVARKAAHETAVLLENNGVLPLRPADMHGKKIALVGQLAGAEGKNHLLGGWSCLCDPEHTVSIEEGLQNALGDVCELVTVRGCGVNCADTVEAHERESASIREAVFAASQCDVIIAVVGEEAGMSGEAYSRSDLTLTGHQGELIDALVATGKPVVLLVSAGRPLILTPYKDKVAALMLIWQPGSSAGSAIADLLTGAVSPSGHLTTSQPVCTGQVPIYYNHTNTGRPALGNWQFESKYRDCQIAPLYPFGYGLSYTTFAFEDIRLSSDKIMADGEIAVTLTVRNTGERDGAEVVQLYIRDLVGSTVRPVKELKAFDKVYLAAGESREITLRLPASELAFHDAAMNRIIEPGKFKLWIGECCTDERYEFDFEII